MAKKKAPAKRRRKSRKKKPFKLSKAQEKNVQYALVGIGLFYLYRSMKTERFVAFRTRLEEDLAARGTREGILFAQANPQAALRAALLAKRLGLA